NVHEPVLGFLLQSSEQPSDTRFRYADLIRPGFENELCLTVGTTLRGPGVTEARAAAALSAMAPAFEIIERRGDFAADLNVSLADNAQQRAYVIGREVLGTPAASIAWLANKLAEMGLALEAGMKVMSGSFTRQYLLSAGDRIE